MILSFCSSLEQQIVFVSLSAESLSEPNKALARVRGQTRLDLFLEMSHPYPYGRYGGAQENFYQAK